MIFERPNIHVPGQTHGRRGICPFAEKDAEGALRRGNRPLLRVTASSLVKRRFPQETRARACSAPDPLRRRVAPPMLGSRGRHEARNPEPGGAPLEARRCPRVRGAMRYHVLAADYDGTIAHHGQVDEATRAALCDLRRSGRRFVLVTGRELDNLLRVFPDLERAATTSSPRTAPSSTSPRRRRCARWPRRRPTPSTRRCGRGWRARSRAAA